MNTDKFKYVLFHKPEIKDNLPLVFPDLFINDAKIKRENLPKFLGVIIDKNLTWKTHVKLCKYKILNSVGILSKASRVLNSKSMQSIYFVLVYPYIKTMIVLHGLVQTKPILGSKINSRKTKASS